MDTDNDAEIITNIFEIQLLQRFWGLTDMGPTVRSADKQKAALITPRNTMASYAKSIGP